MSDTQTAVQDAASTICNGFGDDYWLARDRDGAFPQAFYQAFADAGWLGICVPEDHGGVGLGITEAAIMMRTIAESGAGMSGASCLHINIFGLNPLVVHGTDDQKRRALPAMIGGRDKACFGVTEPNAGLNTTQIKTRAVRMGDRYVVDGQKVWISTAQVANKIMLLARTTPLADVKRPTDGLSLFYTDLDRSKIDVREIDKMGRACVDSNELFIEGLEIPAQDRIGEEGRGFDYILEGLNPERILIASEGVGLGHAALRRAADYARQRTVFDRPIGQNQSIQHPLAVNWMELEAAWLMIRRAAWEYDQGRPCGASANASKYLAGEAGFNACQQAVMTHGGFGYAKEYHVERYLREIMIARIAPISPQLILCYIAERVLGLPQFLLMTYDYIIVGSGAAGSVLAERLSRDPAVRVLVLEAGGPDRNPIHLLPKGFYFTMNSPSYVKSYETERYGDGRTDRWIRGRVVGGSTTINGMMWNRGWAPQYDAWERAGNTGWNWERFLHAFKALEDHELGGNELRGEGGAVPVSIAGPREPVSEAFIAALARHDIGFLDDMNASGEERVGYTCSNIRRGLRVSASRAFLGKARRRRNCTLLDRTEVSRILFDGTAATGVEATRGDEKMAFTARREVLICAGALESPLLLERSGIGDPAILAAAGIPMRVHSPRVGENLHDHCGSTLFQLRLKGSGGYNPQLNSPWRQAWSGFKYLFTRTGVMSFGGHNLVTVFKSDPASPHPDTQGFFTPLSSSAVDPSTGRPVMDRFPGAMFGTYPLYPTSTGSIHVTGPGADDQPRLVPAIPTTEHDRALTIKIFHKTREILATEPFAQLVEAETVPGAALHDDAAVLDYAINTGGRGFHTTGTCAIGPDADDVVDDRLSVRGTSRLRVVDASVFPAMPSGNNNAPTMALAWIAADLILDARTDVE
ncbi:GMC family oxidoreductase N-terminal domain-containing protein [Sphingomonas sp. MG17]|uniref:GMC family oxidoreductase N-terminal domain-containing protein n=1 Tax=Sphingomonas tagetis TaxID=2949092 RepID=A0A9X2HLA4_9SPHN|nr:GMC family oxidoreductase N-terminal domain-containing protein [Sphingomonas tagetis]